MAIIRIKNTKFKSFEYSLSFYLRIILFFLVSLWRIFNKKEKNGRKANFVYYSGNNPVFTGN